MLIIMFGGDFTMHVFLFSFQAFVCHSSEPPTKHI